jgi:hypothetical protein
MSRRSIVRPASASMAVALVALFVGFSGTAFAVGTAVVPLAKRALTADNAKKLGGHDATALVQQASQAPGPASTAARLVTFKIAPWSLSPHSEADFTATCDAGQKAIGGGWTDPGNWSSSYQSFPTATNSGWTTHIWTPTKAPSLQSGTVYAVCLE